MTSQEQRPNVAVSDRRIHHRLPPCDRCATTPSEMMADPNRKQDLRHRPASLRLEDPVEQHRCLDGLPPQTVSVNNGLACSMPNHDAGKTRFAPTRSLDTNLPLVQSLPDHDDEPPLQSLRSWKQSITAETHLTDVVGQTDTLLRQVNGVGPVTSLAYVLTLETPQRFKKSRDVGPYLGLVPQQEDSGDSQ